MCLARFITKHRLSITNWLIEINLRARRRGGRNKLLAAMLANPNQADLGIEKFPAEKNIYRALLKKTRLHREKEGGWAFTAPPRTEGEDLSNMRHVWQRIDDFLDSTEEKARPFSTLSAELMAPPYGLKQGVLAILYIAAYLVNRHEVAIYENGVYTPNLSEEAVERFVKVPHEFTVQRFRIEGLRASIFDQYAMALYNDGKKKTVVELVRPLAIFIGALPDFTKKTRSTLLTGTTQAVRNAFNLAKSPERLLFEDLPKALGFTQADQSTRIDAISADVEGFSAELQSALRELKYAYSKMLEEQQRLLAQAFHISDESDLEKLRKQLSGRYQGLDEYTVDVDGMRAFIRRLTRADGSDDQWFNDILMFLGKKPTKKWTDADRAEVEVKLSDYSKRILDLETLRLHYDKTAERMEGDFDVILLKSLKKGSDPIDEVVAIDKSRHEAIKGVKAELGSVLRQHKDKELQLAILAEYVDEFLANYRDSTKGEKETKDKAKGRIKNA